MSTVCLIKIAGRDQPGVTHSITRWLSGQQVQILDIGQAVIHDNLALGLLAQMPDDTDIDRVVADLGKVLSGRELDVSIDAVGEQAYERWVGEQGKPRHIVSLLARKITAEHIASVTEVVAAHRLNIDRIVRLSGRVPLQESNGLTKACVEVSLRGELADPTALRRALLELSQQLDLDVAYQEDDMYRRNRRLVVFDMDSTLIEAEVIDELAAHAGVGEQVAQITEAAMRGEIDFNESFRRRVALLKGLDESALATVAESLRLTEGAQSLMASLKRLGYKTAILSGGFEYFAAGLKQKLGFDYVYANQLEIASGVVTGNVVGEIVNGERKAALLKELARRENIALEQVIAVGDGANDLPMLSIAGLGIAFRAKPVVKASARQAISTLGLDSILYLLGISDRELMLARSGDI